MKGLMDPHEVKYKFRQRLLFATKTGDHRRHHSRWVQSLEIKRMPCLIGKDHQESVLCPTVALAKGMDRVQLGQEMSGLQGEVSREQIAKPIVVGELSENSAHLSIDVLRIAKGGAFF